MYVVSMVDVGTVMCCEVTRCLVPVEVRGLVRSSSTQGQPLGDEG